MTASKRIGLALASLLVFTALTTSRPAIAADAAGAEVLFSEAKRLVQEGNYAAACPKFEESQKLDPGMGTLYHLGDCYEHIGRTASAWAAFVEVASSAKTSGQQARADDAQKRAADLEANLAKLVLHVATPDLAGLVVKRGDIAVGRAQWNVAMPVDPGVIALEASAPGYKSWRGSVSVGQRTTTQSDVPALEREANPVGDATATTTKHDAASPASGSGWGTQRTLAVVAGAAGVVGLGVGTVFGLKSMSKGSDADNLCDSQNRCEQRGLALRHDAIKAGDLSTIGFVAGGVLAAAGVVLWVTAPSRGPTTGALPSRTPHIQVATRGAGLAFEMEVP